MKLEERTIEDRAKILDCMNYLVCSMNDETAYYSHWINIVPDGADMTDFMDIAEDTELYCEVCKLFKELVAEFGHSGFYAISDFVTP